MRSRVCEYPDIVYPETYTDYVPEGTRQSELRCLLFNGLSALYRKRSDFFIGMSVTWFPLSRAPRIRAVPDIMVVLGRPKGPRDCYQQEEEGDVPPDVIFEVQSPGVTFGELAELLSFYERHGVKEYYILAAGPKPLMAYVRQGERLVKQSLSSCWESPRLGLRFEVNGPELRIIGDDGRPFRSALELANEMETIAAERDRLLAQLWAAGIEPKP